MKKILVVGGAGYIGSYVAKMLNAHHYDVVILDNLSTGDANAVQNLTLLRGDTANTRFLEYIFTEHAIDGVMHFAAYKDVGESVTDPAIYYQNNVANTINLLDTMRRFSIRHFLFSSTAAIFGIPQHLPINESHPCVPINPYGKSKLMVEDILKDFDSAYHIKSCCLRYFNAAGADPSGEIKIGHFNQPNLIPNILNCVKNKRAVKINGIDYQTKDGTCIRDYIHIHDLATAHIAALERLFAGEPSSNYNLGNGQGFSVREVIDSAQKVIGCDIETVEGPRRPGDPAVLLADATLVRKELNWQPQYPEIDIMIRHAWEAFAI